MERVVGGQSDVGRLRRVAVKHARDAFRSDASLDRQWRDLSYTARPDLARATSEYERFLALLRGAGADVHCLPPSEQVGLDSLYVRDASIACDRGLILCNMGKPQRATEPAAQEAAFRTLGLPIIGAITGDGRLEGGDVVWLDERTLAVGRGYRTNDAGIGQLRALLAGSIDELIVVPLPHWRGPADVRRVFTALARAVPGGAPGARHHPRRRARRRVPDAGLQRPRRRPAHRRHGGGQPRDPGAVGARWRPGTRVRRTGDLPQGGWRPHLPNPATGAGLGRRGTRFPILGPTPAVSEDLCRGRSVQR